MQPESGATLTETQKRAYAENQADFAKLDQQIRNVEEAATARLAASGLHFDEDATSCLFCYCTGYEGVSGACDNCNHGRLRHRGFS
jgi:hypothetical protein